MPGLTRKNTAQLKAALDRMPPHLALLRGAILSIARQDQDLLGCGDADLSVLVQTLIALPAKDRPNLPTLAGQLRTWAEQHATQHDLWSGPIFFICGTLLGISGYKQLEELDLPPVPPANGLTKCTVVLPPKMKVKKYAGGIEAKDRDVTIFLIEVDADHEATRVAQWNRIISQEPPFPGVPSVYDADRKFTTGQAKGFKFISRTEPTQGYKVEAREYLLTLGNTKLTASFISNRKFNKDLDQYEVVLASLRLI